MRPLKKSTFALFFGNRGFFPPELMMQARKEMSEKLNELGHQTLMLDADATKHGAVSNLSDAQKYANFLKENEGKFDGVILTLPNFGDESAAVNALKESKVPIYIHAYPDTLDKMSPQVAFPVLRMFRFVWTYLTGPVN